MRNCRFVDGRLEFWDENTLEASIDADWLKSASWPIPAGAPIHFDITAGVAPLSDINPGAWPSYMPMRCLACGKVVNSVREAGEHLSAGCSRWGEIPAPVATHCGHCGVPVDDPAAHVCRPWNCFCGQGLGAWCPLHNPTPAAPLAPAMPPGFPANCSICGELIRSAAEMHLAGSCKPRKSARTLLSYINPFSPWHPLDVVVWLAISFTAGFWVCKLLKP